MGGTEVQTRVAPLANGNFGGSGLQPLELRCVLCGAVVPEADRVLADHARLPLVSGG